MRPVLGNSTPAGSYGQVGADGPAVAAGPSGQEAEESLVLEDLLVQEISIDGMCGVY